MWQITFPTKVVVGASFLVAVSLGGCSGDGDDPFTAIGKTVSGLDPTTETHEEFEGTFVDRIEPGEWRSPFEGDPEAEERASLLPDGRTWARLRSDGIIIEPTISDYVNQVASRLLENSPIQGAPITVVVTARDSFSGAEAHPDGTIALPIGTLRDLKNEDQLAFVLGHEIAHVLLRHHDIDWIEQTQKYMVSAADVGLDTVRQITSNVPGASGAGSTAENYVRAGDLVWRVTRDTFLASWTREQEDEADLLGVDLMVLAGYNGMSAIEFFNRYEAWLEEMRADSAAAAKYDESKEPSADDEAGGFADFDFTSAFGLGLWAAESVWSSLSDDLAATHREVGARRDSLDAYYFDRYADIVPPDVVVARFENNLDRAAGVVGGYAAASQAFAALNGGNTEEAETRSSAALDSGAGSHAKIRLVRAKVLKAKGDWIAARDELHAGIEDPNAGLSLYRELIIGNILRGNVPDALAVGDAAWTDLKEPMTLYPLMIFVARSSGNNERAQQLLIGCRLAYREQEDKCIEAAEGQLVGFAQ